MQKTLRRFHQNYTTNINYRPKIPAIETYQAIDKSGKLIDKSLKFEKEELDIYKTLLSKMIEVEIIENTMLNAKFQGIFSFFMTSFGETGTILGSTAACAPNDPIFSQYREYASLYYRGFTLQELTDNLLGNRKDITKGRQMPIHFSDSKRHFFSVSSPLATNISQAAGFGFGLSQKNEPNIAINYFGEGAASEGDFYAGINFAQTLGSQTLFICRNNGYAISTPISEQTSGDGILPKAMAFEMEGVRVDGNDTVAVFRQTKRLREFILKNKKPAFLEAMTYRISDHSTTDKSTKYRSQEEIDDMRNNNNPISRLKGFLKEQGVLEENWDAKMEANQQAIFAELNKCLNRSKVEKKPRIESMFEEVYSEMPQNLKQQQRFLMDHVNRNKDDYAKEYKLDIYDK